MEHSSPSLQFANHDTPPDRAEVDDILRKKRKAREYKACYPCRQRKVKCDQNVPCKTCVAREHPDLCTYHPPAETHPPAKRISVGTSQNGGNYNGTVYYAPGHSGNGTAVHNGNRTVTIPREDWDRLCSKLDTVERALSDLKGAFRHMGNPHPTPSTHSPSASTSAPTPSKPTLDSASQHVATHGIHDGKTLSGQIVHVGGSSVPALVMALAQGENKRPDVQELLSKSVLPLFGLDNESSLYPFVDLWGLPHGSLARIVELVKALPIDAELMSFFRHFRDTQHVTYPAIADIEKFEGDLVGFLINRGNAQATGRESEGLTEQTIYGKSIQWIGLLFATLASGCQCSTVSRKERELTSQVYVCCSFECLRLTNFLSHVTVRNIQTLLILGNVISNNMNAGVAWSILGLTIRLSQSLGLHKMCPPDTDHQIKKMKTRTWWAVLWQDSLLSITYDRAPSTTYTEYSMPVLDSAPPGNKRYSECMYKLAKIGLEIGQERAKPQEPEEMMQRIKEHRHELQDIMLDAAEHLKDSRRCTSFREQLEHWALYLHISYITSELCRPAISPATATYDVSKTLRKTCIDSLINTIEAFCGIQNTTVFASRSWAAVHRALSSALLLGILGEPARNDRARNLIIDLITILTDITSTVDPSELSAPITRSVAALQKLVNFQTEPPAQSTSLDPAISSTIAPQIQEYSLDEVNQALSNFDASAFNYSPFVDSGISLESSPHSLMDSILWGQKPMYAEYQDH
ncbi:hypothetical protein M501DRAFT_942576 [Patellaria atrata CBS 101060]|uniref:Zn(2)-C6 fungal-type domain-containing protein n=1 Tax=Patellaria atrata CBS 101060 TaxID=1346257 RepID=A0A9P4S316_9PEZI|nr:hypothetical protein M501DRAFT_942576 [Patellaria atrata CBS 101060]